MRAWLRSCTAGVELILAAIFWGFGFIAVIWALPAWDYLHLNFLRFLLGAIAGLIVILPLRRPSRAELLWSLQKSFWPGFWLWALILLQTWGLRFTTVTKSGFVTVLYVVLVPLMDGLYYRRRIGVGVWICVLAALAGVVLIVQPGFMGDWNRGDLLTFLCSFAAALQIIAVDRVEIGERSAFLFNTVQTAWCALLSAFTLPFATGALWPEKIPTEAIAGLLSLALGSTLIAFFFQVKAQRVLSPTVSSLFFLLESPFALLFAFWLLHERLNPLQGLGALLIFMAAAIATIVAKSVEQQPR